jgi:hypothetical protein
MPAYDCGAADCGECQREFGPDRSAAIANYERREKHFALIETARKNHTSPPCRVCLSVDKVAVYDGANPFLTVCPDCCETGVEHADGEAGHVWVYERSERGNVCDKCGQIEHDDVGYISDRERI